MKQRIINLNASNVIMGIESEALRIQRNGVLAMTAHPFPLDTKGVTMDFSESQLEIVTSPQKGVMPAYYDLQNLYSFAKKGIGDEYLWPMSMPPVLPDEKDIPIADFKNSTNGHIKNLYREGLALRYGKKHQLICGIHVNISASSSFLRSVLPSAASLQDTEDLYLKAARGFIKYLDVMILLTGASPVAAADFPTIKNTLPVISLRNSNAGYSGNKFVPFYNLADSKQYWSQLGKGLNTVSVDFHKLGLVKDGKIIQLSDRLFQSPKEFYAPIRLRRIYSEEYHNSGYLELRFFDKDPFSREGISVSTLCLVHLLFVFFLIDKKPYEINIAKALATGRNTAELSLEKIASNKDSQVMSIVDKGKALIGSLYPLSQFFDNANNTQIYTRTIEAMINKLKYRELLPSVRLYTGYERSGLSWTEYGCDAAGKFIKGELYELQSAGV